MDPYIKSAVEKDEVFKAALIAAKKSLEIAREADRNIAKVEKTGNKEQVKEAEEAALLSARYAFKNAKKALDAAVKATTLAAATKAT